MIVIDITPLTQLFCNCRLAYLCLPAVKKGDENAVTDTGIINDGAWQRRGHSSLNGFVATISVETGKILDGEVMSRKCKSCEQYKKIESAHPIV